MSLYSFQGAPGRMRNALLIALLFALGCAGNDAADVTGAVARDSAAANLDGISRGDVRAKDVDVSATTAPTTAPDAGTRPGDFAKGTRFASVYGSTIFGDEGKGEMYLLHAGVGYYIADYQSINLDGFGGYVRSGIDDNGGVIGLDAVYRNHFLHGGGDDDDDWTVYFEGGLGLQQASTNFSGERHFNFRTRVGIGATFEISEDVRAFFGGTYQHISDAGISGEGGGFDGPMLYGGVTFPF